MTGQAQYRTAPTARMSAWTVADLVGPGVGQHHPAVVADQHGARLDVAVRHAGGVQGGDRVGDRVPDGDGLVGLQRAVLVDDAARSDVPSTHSRTT